MTRVTIPVTDRVTLKKCKAGHDKEVRNGGGTRRKTPEWAGGGRGEGEGPFFGQCVWPKDHKGRSSPHDSNGGHFRSTFLTSWRPNERRLLFATRNGTPWDQSLLLKRKFKPLLKALGIQLPRGHSFYILRHENATFTHSKVTPGETRPRGRFASHRNGLHTCDQRGRKACCGSTGQCSLGSFGRNWKPVGRKWTQKEKRPRSGVS
jgi:hypothetical protein